MTDNVNEKNSTPQLEDVNIIRPIIIVLLVLYHSFIIYGGGWILPEDIKPVRPYFWIAKFSYSFLLEMFVFVSGYLFSFQVYELKKEYSLKNLVCKKFKRLILPSLFFSIIYLVSFTPIDQWMSLSSLLSVISGKGHMWFLPMLFWVFIEAFLLMKLRIRDEYKVGFLFLLAIVSFVPLPFRIGRSLYYLFYFNLGTFLLKNKTQVLKMFWGKISLIGLVLLFVLLFVPLTLLRENLLQMQMNGFFERVLRVSALNLIKIIYATVGLFTTFVFANFLTEIKGFVSPRWLINVNGLCFGVYLFQQFILKFLYYKTPLPIWLGSYWLPIVGFILTLILSVFMSKFAKNTQFGRCLIG